MRGMFMLLMGLIGLLMAVFAQGATTVEWLGTEPSGNPVVLGANQHFYVHLQYTSDVPTHLWVRPYFKGEPADAGSNPSRIYPAGSGDALGWFFFFKPGVRVDEVRITAGDGSRAGTYLVASHAVQVTSGADAASSTDLPDWVVTLSAADEAARHAAYEKSMQTPTSAADISLFNGFMLIMYGLCLLGVGWPVWGVWRWSGHWRLVALVPGAAMTFVVLRIIIDTSRDPTSHNLWPFEIVMWGLLSAGWMGAASVLRRLLRERVT